MDVPYQKLCQLIPGMHSLLCLFKLNDEYTTKEQMTLWKYDLSSDPKSVTLKKDTPVKVLDCSTKWWKVQCKPHTGFASKHYFAKRFAEPFERKDWYFGQLPREESEKALKMGCNREGAFLVRCKRDVGKNIYVLSVKHSKQRADTQTSQISHFPVDVDEEDTYSLCKERYFSLEDLILHHQNTSHNGIKLSTACLLPSPHTDPGFAYAHEDHDGWSVPLTEIQVHLDQELGCGQFGKVYAGTFRKKIKVAVKIIQANKENPERVLKDFTNEKDVMARLNHPNLVQLFAVTKNDEEDNLLILELMEVSLLVYLKRISAFKDRTDFPETSFKSILRLCVQVARGMAHLERLGIVHRDLAARNVLLDENKTAKVSDFGLSRSCSDLTGDLEKLPEKWTSPEALFENKFSSSSDVWSFGILIFEIFSFGNKPFRQFGNTEFRQKMREDFEKKRNEFRDSMPWQLTTATEKELGDVYKIMKKCWDIDPEERPKFYNLQVDLDHFKMTGDLIGYDSFTNEDGDHVSNTRPSRTFSSRINNRDISTLID